MLLEQIHLNILQLLWDNLSEDLSDVSDISRKILFKSVNHKPRQIEKACQELETQGFVRLHKGFYKIKEQELSVYRLAL